MGVGGGHDPAVRKHDEMGVVDGHQRREKQRLRVLEVLVEDVRHVFRIEPHRLEYSPWPRKPSLAAACSRNRRTAETRSRGVQHALRARPTRDAQAYLVASAGLATVPVRHASDGRSGQRSTVPRLRDSAIRDRAPAARIVFPWWLWIQPVGELDEK